MIGIGVGIGFAQKARTVLVSDSFNRADSAVSLGTADSGQIWEPFSGTWGINNNKAYLASATPQAVAAVEALNPNVSITCDFTLSPNRAGMGIIVRGIDDGNYILIPIDKTSSVDTIAIYKKDSGAFTALANITGAGFVSGATYRVTVTAVGNSITVYVNGVLRLSHTLSGANATKFGTPTKCGMRINAGASADDGSRYDDFKVEAV